MGGTSQERHEGGAPYHRRGGRATGLWIVLLRLFNAGVHHGLTGVRKVIAAQPDTSGTRGIHSITAGALGSFDRARRATFRCQGGTLRGEHVRGGEDEADLSAECTATVEEAWIPQAHADACRAGGTQCPPAQRTGQVVGLITGVARRASFGALKSGFTVRAGLLSVRYAPTSGDAAEVAYAIRRSAGSAVVRNRCRRRLRACLRALDERTGVRPGIYLIGVRDEAVEAAYQELEMWMSQAIEALARRNEGSR